MKDSSINILLFKAHAINMKNLTNVLSEEKEYIFNMECVDTIEEGIRFSNEHSIDVILMELTISNSIELEKFNRVYTELPDIPIIIFTGVYDRNTAIQALSIGAQDYLPPKNLDGERIIRSILYSIERNKIRIQLKEALDKIQTLSGLLPICAKCKNIRNDHGYWQQVEAYITTITDTTFTYSICPECIKKIYPEFYEKISKKATKHEEIIHI